MSDSVTNAILCVDDETIILKSLKAQLKSHFTPGYRLEFAESAKEGLELIQDFHNDGIKILVVVSDWLMPGMRGDEFLIEIHKKYPSIKKIMLTGQADPAAIQKAESEANLHKLISKPWDEDDLVQTIRECIETND